MSNILYILILIFTIGCKNHKNGNPDNNLIKYSEWSSSIEKSIKNNSDLKDYERDNLLSISKSVSENDFLKLKNTLNENNILSKKATEYYMLFFSEGEVVTTSLYYIVKIDNKYLMASINLTEKEKVFRKVEEESEIIKAKLVVNPFSKENEYQDIVVLTKLDKTKLVSIIGNPVVSFP